MEQKCISNVNISEEYGNLCI